VYKHKALPIIALMIEQEPTVESRIELSDETDIFGVPKAKINWIISPKTWETINAIAQFLKQEFDRLSLGEVTIYPHISTKNQDWASHLTDANHHIGGTRMSKTPESGVVNSHLSVWGHDNIYVCSTSVFPTGSHSNPTLTLMALCLRLVDYLEK
jgi:choline dehydrogenase-like flavoprotein